MFPEVRPNLESLVSKFAIPKLACQELLEYFRKKKPNLVALTSLATLSDSSLSDGELSVLLLALMEDGSLMEPFSHLLMNVRVRSRVDVTVFERAAVLDMHALNCLLQYDQVDPN